MKVLVFSDSHGYNMSMAYAIEREKPDAVLHLGDHTDDADDIRRAFPALTIYHVRGNNDFDMDVPLFAVVTVGGVRMYLTHGHRERVSMLHSGLVPARAREEGCSFAFFGHTHRMMAERTGRFRVQSRQHQPAARRSGELCAARHRGRHGPYARAA